MIATTVISIIIALAAPSPIWLRLKAKVYMKVAGRSDGWLAIADGLIEGDVVVTNGVEALWCIELQTNKGGYACCAVAKKE